MRDNRSLSAATPGRARAPHGARPIRNPKSRTKNNERGAAFLIAIAILVILVAIGTTFFSVSRIELKTATNVGNTVRVDLLNDAANAIAIHHLNQYFLRTPEVTAQDHSFKSLFNGSAFAGKSWARRKEPTPVDPTPIVGKSMLQYGLPEVDINRIQNVINQAAANLTGANGQVVLYWPEDGHKEQLFRGSRSNNWLYIPRFQTASAADNPFAPATPDYILLYDYEGNVADLRANPPADNAPRAIELRVEDGTNNGLGTLVAATPDDLNSINAELANLGPIAADVRLFYFSDMDPNNTGDPAEAQGRYSFVTAAIYKENGLDDNGTDASTELGDYGANPFALFDFLTTGYPEEQLARIGDVDNDGDGYADSIWMPIPEDVFLPNDQIDNDLDGMIDETQDNGINDDGDTIFDINGQPIGPRTDYDLPRNPDGTPQESPDGIIAHDIDEAIEAGALVYNGLGPYVELDTGLVRAGDGLDNDGDREVDEADEDRLFLTSPLPGVRVPLDLDGDGAASTIENFRPYDPANDTFPSLPYQVLNPAVIIAPSITVRYIDPNSGTAQTAVLTNADVDAIDNDYDLLLNDFFAYGYIGPWQPGDWQPVGNWAPGQSGAFANQIAKSYNDLNRAVWNQPGTYLVGTAINAPCGTPGGQTDWATCLGSDPFIGNLPQYILESLRITHSGEPVCNLVGRAAIEINDEASKVNLNVAGAETFHPFPFNNQGLVQPAFGQGTTPGEYDLGTFPGFSTALASKLSGYRTGGPGGIHLARDIDTDIQAATQRIVTALATGDPNTLTGQIGNEVLDYAYDASFPGLGRVDDNGNALLAALDGLDNDGNGLADEGFISPLDLPANFDEVIKFRDRDITRMELQYDPDPDGLNDERFTDPAQLAFARRWFRIGAFEGIDEPAERQLFNPLRNTLAEADLADNDAGYTTADQTTFTDEIGELGDRVFQNANELSNVSGIGDGTVSGLNRLATLHSTDRNVDFVPTEIGLRAINKTDINRASAKQLAAKLLLTSDIASPLKLIDRQAPFDVLDNSGLQLAGLDLNQPALFADGLRQGDMRLIAHDPNTDDGVGPDATQNPVRGGFLFHRTAPNALSLSGATEMPLDQILEFMQLAVNIADARDAGHTRSQLTTERTDLVQKTAADLGLSAVYAEPLPSFAELATPTTPVKNWPTDPSPQEAIDEDALFPLEEIQNHLEDVMNLSPEQRRLQITDQWWTDLDVESDTVYPSSSTNFLPEQRHISYTAAGVESIRINELMVRPVRRVEAEAFPNSDPLVSFPSDPLDAAGVNKFNLDPTPFAESQIAQLAGDVIEDLPDTYPHPAGGGTTKEYINAVFTPPTDTAVDSLMPEFSIERLVSIKGYSLASGDPDTGLQRNSNSQWQLSSNNGGVLGESTGVNTPGTPVFMTRTYDIPSGTQSEQFMVPDVLEFVFTEANSKLVGLPDGRYYLAVKLEDADDSFRDVVSRGRLRYSIKTHPNDSIISDIEDLLDDIDSEADATDQGAAYTEFVDYFTNNFMSVPAEHMANGPGEPAGWVFLDATPADMQNARPRYFLQFPPAFNLEYTLGIETVIVRVWVRQRGENSWEIYFRSTQFPGLGRDVPIEIRDGSGVRLAFPVTTDGNPNGAQQSLDAALPLSDAQLEDVIAGEYTLSIDGISQVLEPSATPTPVETSHAVTIPDYEDNVNRYRLSVALTTSPMPLALGDSPSDDEVIAIRFNEIDTDNSGSLTFAEITTFNSSYTAAQFNAFNLNGDLVLTKSELNASGLSNYTPASIGVNFFDFSQEPDHEYIELANVSDDAIDLSNWLLEVGPQQTEGMPYTPFTTQWRVPQGTFISPGGMLLLTFNKFDDIHSPSGPSDNNLIYNNGLGMARGTVPTSESNLLINISDITVPPIKDNSSDAGIYSADSQWYDPTGSVFDRFDDPATEKNERVDYVDDYGAGVSTNHVQVPLRIDPERPEKGVVADQTRANIEGNFTSSAVNPTPNSPWDRIIELENVRLWQKSESLLSSTTGGNVHTMADITSVDKLARFVLRGGVLPNYPEHDGMDNDGDGGYIALDGSYRYGILETDMLDNDLNGFTDERVQNVDIDGDGTIDLPIWPFSSEGVDEGNLGLLRQSSAGLVPYHQYGPGSFEFGTLPVFLNPNRAEHNDFFAPFLPNGNPQIYSPFDAVRRVDFDPNTQTQIFPTGLVPVFDGGISNTLTQYQVSTNSTFLPGSIYLFVVTISNWSSDFVRIDISPVSAGEELSSNGPFGYIVTTNNATSSFRITAPITTSLTIDSIEIFEIAPNGVPGQSLAVGITNEFLAQRSLGNQNQFYATELGQRYAPINPAIEPVGGFFPNADALYLGSDLDPPDWKAFSERRMYPGDNVIVSLYDATGGVADRVTYTENDVINRTKDDVVASPYSVGGYHDYQSTEGVQNEVGDIVSLHPDYPTFWLPNQMGLDFYRSLERKHTLAAGDRFGTQNRWQATDGNYDDWADSISLFVRRTELTNDAYSAQPSLLAAQRGFLGSSPAPERFLELSRFYSGSVVNGGLFFNGLPTVEDNLRLYGHAIWGTPLRMNTAMRKVANPVDPLRLPDRTMPNYPNNNGLAGRFLEHSPPSETMLISQFYTAPDIPVALGAGTGDDIPTNLWQQRQAEQKVRNDAYNAPIDLGEIPHITYQHAMMNVPRAIGGLQGLQYSYLHDPLRLNFLTAEEPVGNNPIRLQYFNDISQRSTLARHSEALTEGAERPLGALLDASATDNLTLTVAQANFLPIQPDVFTINSDDLPSGTDPVDLLRWRYTNGSFPAGTPDKNIGEPPAAWSPVFLFGNPNEVLTPESFTINSALDYRKLPFYARFPQSGAVNTFKVDPTAFLFEDSFLFAPEDWQRGFYPFYGVSPAVAPDVASAQQQVLRRWPLDKRVVMYVSKPRNKAPGIPMLDQYRPEALWVWDAEDGLENGEYEVYIGTWMPGLAQAINDVKTTVNAVADAEPDLLQGLLGPNPDFLNVDSTPANGIVTQFATQQIATRDPAINADTVSGSPFKAEYEIDVLTDPTTAQGLKQGAGDKYGLMPSAQWQPSVTYRANAAGYIFYGTDSASGWQPIIVRVTDNFLALRVRHAGTAYETGAISHVVLAPRKRTPGRININTAQFQVAQQGGNVTLAHPLAGLPGILDLGGEFGIPLDTGAREQITNPVASAPVSGANKLPEPYDMVVGGTLTLGNITDPFLGDFASLPPATNPDGLLKFTYDPLPPFERVSATGSLASIFNGVDLNDDSDFLPALRRAVKAGRYLLLAMMQLGRTEYQDGRYYKGLGDFLSDEIAFDSNFQPAGSPNENVLHPLSNTSDAEARNAEVQERLRRIANAISVRSDVFEIITTVQSGYGIDADGNGHYDYRDNREFITTAETRSRMVYERRVPSDNSDESDVSTQ